MVTIYGPEASGEANIPGLQRLVETKSRSTWLKKTNINKGKTEDNTNLVTKTKTASMILAANTRQKSTYQPYLLPCL